MLGPGCCAAINRRIHIVPGWVLAGNDPCSAQSYCRCDSKFILTLEMYRCRSLSTTSRLLDQSDDNDMYVSFLEYTSIHRSDYRCSLDVSMFATRIQMCSCQEHRGLWSINHRQSAVGDLSCSCCCRLGPPMSGGRKRSIDPCDLPVSINVVHPSSPVELESLTVARPVDDHASTNVSPQ